jgi:hypothetical protein
MAVVRQPATLLATTQQRKPKPPRRQRHRPASDYVVGVVRIRSRNQRLWSVSPMSALRGTKVSRTESGLCIASTTSFFLSRLLLCAIGESERGREGGRLHDGIEMYLVLAISLERSFRGRVMPVTPDRALELHRRADKRVRHVGEGARGGVYFFFCPPQFRLKISKSTHTMSARAGTCRQFLWA